MEKNNRQHQLKQKKIVINFTRADRAISRIKPFSVFIIASVLAICNFSDVDFEKLNTEEKELTANNVESVLNESNTDEEPSLEKSFPVKRDSGTE